MGTLSKSIKKIKKMEEELFTIRLHLDNLRVKLKKPKYFMGVDYSKDSKWITTCDGFVDLNGNYHVTTINTKPIEKDYTNKLVLMKKDIGTLKKGKTYLCLGEILNMKEYYILVDGESKIIWGYHSDNFKLLEGDET